MQTELTASPGNRADRVVALDALRGLAVVGIVPMNVIAFSMPPAAYFNPRVFGGDGPLEIALWAVGFVLIEDKFRALFAMMFGAGVAILLGKASEHPLRGHYARMLVLFVIAMLHAVLLANNDVLRVYAVAGLLLPFAVNWQTRTLLWSAGVIVLAQLAISGWYAWDWLMAVGDPAAQEVAESLYGENPSALADAAARADAGLAERVAQRLGTLPQQSGFVVASLPSALAAMLVGMALWKNGLFAGEWSGERIMRLARRCVVIAIPVLIGLAAWSITSGFDPIITTANALVWSAPFDLLLGIGWAALGMAAFARGGTLAERLAATGRLALTNYLATSLVFAAVFMGLGLDLFAQVTRGQALLLGLIPIALMFSWSPLWLARFRQGPAEWFWRSVAQGHILPFKR
ncbi:DUF418 domain-containing protein [Aurantiacibacter sp. D1-12]|uniref:DUF418 domain-containing protein n=1 Tax=Aurantiacibacter sp. D1-12 TaxID=2993658 RepID=UPI00237CC085|nr:DUF418 domain-containing protein [Aurantiacibacter sp. D1-12]MDE1468528.1 DUF418 domain-containing protein [Aurantiacibacter sp. D1-12]